MRTKTKMATEFAVLMLAMCENDFLPCFDNCTPDMSDISESDQNRQKILAERTAKIQEEVVTTHLFGQYFLEKGYSWREVMEFVLYLELERVKDAVRVLNETPSY